MVYVVLMVMLVVVLMLLVAVPLWLLDAGVGVGFHFDVGVCCTISSHRKKGGQDEDHLHVLLDPLLAQFLVLLLLGRDQFHCYSTA